MTIHSKPVLTIINVYFVVKSFMICFQQNALSFTIQRTTPNYPSHCKKLLKNKTNIFLAYQHITNKTRILIKNVFQQNYDLFHESFLWTSFETCRTVYFSYIEYIFRYSIISWGNSVHRKNLFLSKKKIIRIIAQSN